MNRLHKDTDSEMGKGERGTEGRDAKSKFSKWLLAPAAGAAMMLGLHACGDRTIDNYVPIPPNSQQNDGGIQNDGGPDADTDADVTDGGRPTADATGERMAGTASRSTRSARRNRYPACLKQEASFR